MFHKTQAIVLIIAKLSTFFVEVHSFTDFRLPSDVLPSSYNITIRPYLRSEDGIKQFTFDGEVFIDIVPQKPTDEIVLHSKNLNYTKMVYWKSEKTDQIFEFLNSTIDPVTDKFTLKLSERMLAGEHYHVFFAYIGELKHDTAGVFRSPYKDEQNITRWIAATRFKPHHARQALPCFDEPKFRATFQVTIIRHENFRSVSNARMLSSNLIELNTFSDIYERSAQMSTYNLAFLVAEFSERGNDQFKIVSRSNYLDQTNFTFEVGQKLLQAFDKYLAMPYYGLGVDKMDLATISDFEGNFAENWGLLTFSESHLSYDDEKTTTTLFRVNVATNIAFQLAQMWFGNLVTCEWWSHAWLSEGFASYFANMLTATIYPEWGLEKYFVVHQLQYVLAMDSSVHSRPLNHTIDGNPKHLDQIFDEITYKKGSSIIRMFQHAMGEEAFRASLITYLNEFKYKTVVPGNLLKHLESNWPNTTKQYASKVFNSFTTQVGYPLITVNVSTNGTSMEISQKHFGTLNASILYTVPFTYTTNQETDFHSTQPKIFLEAKSISKIIDLNSDDWIIANIQQTGYYRVNYNKENWLKIHNALQQANWSGIHELNRAQIVSDLLYLARNEDISYSLALECLDYLKTETKYSPWSAAFYGYTALATRLGSLYKKNFGDYIIDLTDRVFKELGFEDRTTDSILDIHNRKNVITWACMYGNQECIAKALTYFRAMDTTPVPVNFRFAVYCTAMMHATDDEFNNFVNKLKATTSPAEKSAIFCSLGCVKNPKSLETLINMIMSDEVGRDQKPNYLIWLCEVNPDNVSPVLKFVIENCDNLVESLGSFYEVAKLVYQIADKLTTEAEKKDLELFRQSNNGMSEESISLLDDAIKLVEENLLWSAKHMADIITHLKSYSKSEK